MVPALLALPLIITSSLHPMCVVAVKICIACKYVSSKVRLLLAWSLRDLIKEVDKKTLIFLHITEILRKLLWAILAFSVI